MLAVSYNLVKQKKNLPAQKKKNHPAQTSFIVKRLLWSWAIGIYLPNLALEVLDCPETTLNYPQKLLADWNISRHECLYFGFV